jgi:YihY family inner membrane protein
MNPVERVMRNVDAYQQGRSWLAFPFGVIKKFGDDRAGYLAALIAYYGFFSIFPLLLVFATALGLILGGDSSLRDSILHSTVAQFPVIGDQIQTNSLKVSGVALAVGIVGALWAGIGVTQAAQNAMNEVWDVKIKDRPNFLISRLRSLIMLAVLGTFTIVATFLSGLGAAHGTSFGFRVLTVGGSLVVNLGLFMVSFRVLTRRNLTWGDVFPGAAFGAVAWTAVQLLGTYYITHQVANAKSTYGTFAFVIGLLVWIYLGAQITLYAAEINVVRKGHLWPRSLIQPPLTIGDKRTLKRRASVEERRPEEDVHVHFDPSGSDPGAGGDLVSDRSVPGSNPGPARDNHRYRAVTPPNGPVPTQPSKRKRRPVVGAAIFIAGAVIGRRSKARTTKSG